MADPPPKLPAAVFPDRVLSSTVRLPENVDARTTAVALLLFRNSPPPSAPDPRAWLFDTTLFSIVRSQAPLMKMPAPSPVEYIWDGLFVVFPVMTALRMITVSSAMRTPAPPADEVLLNPSAIVTPVRVTVAGLRLLMSSTRTAPPPLTRTRPAPVPVIVTVS